jgi:Eukaryotic-type carbonic anhydrase
VSAPIDVLATEAPTDASTSIDDGGSEPPPIDCQSYRDQGVNINRICKPDPYMCCQVPRSSSNYCHEIYTIFGDDMESACHHCCMEEDNGEPLQVGPANDPHPDGLEPYDKCDELDNTSRLCKDQGCCDAEFAETEYCQNAWASHIGDVERICWSCCFPSKLFPEPNTRQLLANRDSLPGRDGSNVPNSRVELLSTLEEKIDYENTETEDKEDVVLTAMTEDEMRLFHKNNPPELRAGDRIFEHPTMERKLIVRKENFTPKGEKDEDAYFEEIHSAFQQRQLQEPIKENYEDVYWWPYEWLLKVGTEYYFRYEGSMTVPPCYTVNHWRTMKDPIRVAKHQIQELERLLAWRLNGDCNASTAGKPREGNPDAVDVNRPLQELEKGHRLVFCECQDWPSKFPHEREWCAKWQTRDPELRLYDNPYNWIQSGF